MNKVFIKRIALLLLPIAVALAISSVFASPPNCDPFGSTDPIPPEFCQTP